MMAYGAETRQLAAPELRKTDTASVNRNIKQTKFQLNSTIDCFSSSLELNTPEQ
jgi:hypothetical protein